MSAFWNMSIRSRWNSLVLRTWQEKEQKRWEQKQFATGCHRKKLQQQPEANSFSVMWPRSWTPRLNQEFWKFVKIRCNFSKIFQTMSAPLSSCIFVYFPGFFPSAVAFPFQHIRDSERINHGSYSKPYHWSRQSLENKTCRLRDQIISLCYRALVCGSYACLETPKQRPHWVLLTSPFSRFFFNVVRSIGR